MGVTYTAAIERDYRRTTVVARRFDASHALFLATSVVCLLAIAMAYLGRVRTIPGSEASGAPILLVPGQRAEALEPAFAGLSRRRRIAAPRRAQWPASWMRAWSPASRCRTWRHCSRSVFR